MPTSQTDDQPDLHEFRDTRREAIRKAPTPRCGMFSLLCIWLLMAVVALGTLACLWEAVKALFNLDVLRLLGSLLAAGVSHGLYSVLSLASDYGSGKK